MNEIMFREQFGIVSIHQRPRRTHICVRSSCGTTKNTPIECVWQMNNF